MIHQFKINRIRYSKQKSEVLDQITILLGKLDAEPMNPGLGDLESLIRIKECLISANYMI